MLEGGFVGCFMPDTRQGVEIWRPRTETLASVDRFKLQPECPLGSGRRSPPPLLHTLPSKTRESGMVAKYHNISEPTPGVILLEFNRYGCLQCQ